jgi:flagellar motor switch protein FliM
MIARLAALTLRDVEIELESFDVVDPELQPTAERLAMEIRSIGDEGIHRTMGALLMAPATIVALGDLFMGGRAILEDRTPSAFEARLVARRLTASFVDVWGALGADADSDIQVSEHVAEAAATTRSLVVGIVIAVCDKRLEVALVLHQMLGGRPGETASMAVALRDVPILMSVRFAATAITAGELASLQAGDVVRLDHRHDHPLIGEVEGKPMLVVRSGSSGGRIAVEVEDLIIGGAGSRS